MQQQMLAFQASIFDTFNKQLEQQTLFQEEIMAPSATISKPDTMKVEFVGSPLPLHYSRALPSLG